MINRLISYQNLQPYLLYFPAVIRQLTGKYFVHVVLAMRVMLCLC